MSERLVFLGIVDRGGGIYIPWRGNTVFPAAHGYETGQHLLVTLEINENNNGTFVTAELPTLEQMTKIRQELDIDWARMTGIFQQSSMAERVAYLRALDREIRIFNQSFLQGEGGVIKDGQQANVS